MRGKIVGDGLETGAWAMTCRWSLLGNYDVLVKHTVTAPIADDAILERAIKQGLPLFSQKRGLSPFSINLRE